MTKINKKIGLLIFLALFLLPFFTINTFAVPQATDSEVPGSKSAGTSDSGTGDTGPKFAAYVSECGSIDNGKGKQVTPPNCLFLEEPIGGQAGYDLYKVVTGKNDVRTTILWNGGSLTADEHGPIQAILTEDPSKTYCGPFCLLYGYIGLIYKYMSGIIIGVAVLFTVYGGVLMSMSQGDQTKFSEGKKHIVKAIEGIIVWFTVSLILYTINPTFFTFLQ